MTRSLLHRLRRDDRGASLVEYAIAVALFLFFIFAVIDFGRLFYNWNMTEKAVAIAARMAAVRPPICAGVPTSNARGTSVLTTRFGDSCTTGAGVCAGDSGGTLTQTCDGTTVSATATEIWTRLQGALPPNATPANLRYTYSFDPRMNFLGGPYVPTVTVEVQNLNFQFISPIRGLARIAGGGTVAGAEYGTIPFPSLSVSLPGEDLALGDAG